MVVFDRFASVGADAVDSGHFIAEAVDKELSALVCGWCSSFFFCDSFSQTEWGYDLRAKANEAVATLSDAALDERNRALEAQEVEMALISCVWCLTLVQRLRAARVKLGKLQVSTEV